MKSIIGWLIALLGLALTRVVRAERQVWTLTETRRVLRSLKALRDAIEDYEYLAILQRLGKTGEAQKVVRSLTESFLQWNKDPAAYEKARAELAAIIIAATVERGK